MADTLLIGAETGIVDESQYARPLTAVGGATRTTAQSKYGTASLNFDGTGGYISAPDSLDWNFGAGDFTVEGWFRLARNSDQALIGQWDNIGDLSNASWYLYIVGTIIYFRMVWGTSITDLIGISAPTLNINQWYHIAATRNGTDCKLFLDGVLVGTQTVVQTLNNSTNVLTIGKIGTGATYPSYNFSGQIDELRVTKGLARYTAAFTPPTGPFPRETGATVATISIPLSVPTQIEANTVYALPARAHILLTSVNCDVAQSLLGPWTLAPTTFVGASFIKCSSAALVTCKTIRR